MSKPSQHTHIWKAISHFLKGYFQFSGRATRSEFNYVIPLLGLWVLISAFVFSEFVLGSVSIRCLSQEELGDLYFFGLEGTCVSINSVVVVIYFVWLLLTVPPFLSLWVRRGHDIGVDTPSSIATFFVPWVNIMTLLCYSMFDSDRGRNLYGDSEKYPDETIPKKADTTPVTKTLETTVPANSVKTKFCPHCGNEIPEHLAFCTHCGGKQSNT